MDACASCHAPDGRGYEISRVGFDTPLPDFTDCSFATREPDSDWVAVAHQGGPARGFSNLMPAFGEALTDEDFGLVMSHVRSFCQDRNWPRGDLNLPRPLVTEKAYPEDEAVWTVAVPLEGDPFFQNTIVYEKRFGARNQLELVVPFGWRKDGEWKGAVNDVAISFKRALFHSLESGSILSINGEVVLPTGNHDRGFGKGTTIFEPFVSYGQILPSDFFLHFQGGFEFPFDTDRAENEAFWRFVLGRSFTQGQFGRSWSPMLEILAGRELVSQQSTNWDLVPQCQLTLNRRQHVMLNVGIRFPVTDSRNRDTALLVYILWDWFDGGFFEGW
jgi:hypothetical protein